MPNSLADDLRTARHHILRAHLAADYDVAFDAMLYSMAKKALANCYVDGLPMDVSLTSYYAPNADKLLSGSVADRMLIALKEGLNLDWVDLEQPADFKAMCLLSVEDKQNLFAWVAATALKGQLSSDNRPSAVIEELGARMDVDVAACWRPTVANYWGSVTKAHIALIAGEVIGDDFAEERSAEKKIDAATAMEPAFAENALEAAGLEKAVAIKTSRWLPKGMEFAEAKSVDEMIDDKTPTENSDPDDALPAFLAADTAA
jgi:ParB family chromosome partitioning protein